MRRHKYWCGSAAILSILYLSLVAVTCTALPVFPSTPYIATVSELTPIGSILINVTALPSTPGNTLTYNIFNHNSTIFQIESTTGSVVLVGSLDYEQVTSHDFNVEVIEESDAVMTEVTINVVNEDDNPLKCDRTLVVLAIPEGPPPNPSGISLSCADRDEPALGGVSYQIEPGSDASLFSIDSDGTVHITSDLDYEQQRQHECIVNATNGASGTAAQSSPVYTLLINILIVVKPVNEYIPVLENNETTITFFVGEDAAIGSAVGTVRASDADQGSDGDLIFTAVSQSTPNSFTIVSSTGQLLIARALDYEQAESHELTVVVSDSSLDASKRHSVTATVVISVENVNEHNPAFSQEVYSVSVSELANSSSEVISLECTDDDSDPVLTHSIITSNDTNHFAIDPYTGSVTLTSAIEFDPNSPSVFQLAVRCTDSGSPMRSAQTTLFVFIEGHNRNLPPLLNRTEYVVFMSEGSVPGSTVVASLSSVTSDTNRGLAGPLQFALIHDTTCPQDIFQIDPVSGTVYTVDFLNYEDSDEYSCVVSVSNIESTASAELEVFVGVTNANDEVPLCESTLYTLTVPEQSTVGTDILTLSCSDDDGDSLEFSMEGISSMFQLTQSGILSLLTPLNSDVHSTHHIHVNVSDGVHAIELSVLVYVEPSNEHVPTFSQSVYDCSVSEEAAIGSVFCTVTATDSDSGRDGEISYSISSGNEHNKFAIDSKSGDIVLSGNVDYEIIQGYLILVKASDNGNSPFTATVQVRITILDSNDNAPVISPLIAATIAENSGIGTVVANLECTDADSGPNGDVALTIDSLVAVDIEGIEIMETGIFRIDPASNELLTDSNIDYETSVLYTGIITCRDNGNLSLTSSGMILVSITPLNEFAPAFSQANYSATIIESSSIGTSLLQVVAVDDDEGLDGRVVYSIEVEPGGMDFLQISETSGYMTTRQLINCDRGQEHSFTITAADRGNPVRSSQSRLYVTLESCGLGQLTPQETIYFADVMENSPADTEVTVVICDYEREWQGGGSPEYSILSPIDSPFQIDSVTGEISVYTPPDYEQTSLHVLQLSCADPSNTESYAAFSVYITILPDNEHSPLFTVAAYETEIAEDVSPGASVLRVEARDDDAGNDGSVVYSIQEESMQLFIVDLGSGVVYTLGSLDREKVSSHLFHIMAADQMAQGDGVRSSVTEIRVNVADTNDNSPQCDRIVYHIQVSPLVNAGHKVVGLKCTDADAGLNAELHYSLYTESASSIDMFTLDENTGDLILARKYDDASAVAHQLTVTIKDGGVPTRSAVVRVVVELQSSPVTPSDGTEDNGSPAGDEGLKNSVMLTLRDMSIELWNAGGKESFKIAMAHSITYHCALFPEACSLLSGCAHFYRRKRSTEDNFFTVFSEDDIVILPQSIHESTGSDGSTHLNVTFYITLPEGVQKTDYRTTDYVVPRATLVLLLRDEQSVIESRVRDSVAPPLTQRAAQRGGDDSLGWVWGVVATLAVVGSCVCVAVVILLIIRKWKSIKKGVTIFPHGNVILRGEQRDISHTSPDSRSENQHATIKKRRLSLRDLVQFPTLTNRVELNQRQLTPMSEEQSWNDDDISTIDLVDVDSNESSLQGQPRSHNSPALGSDDMSGNTVGRSQHSTSQDSLGDYKQNFPFEPPRQTVCAFRDRRGMETAAMQTATLHDKRTRGKVNTVPPWKQANSHS